MLMLSRCVEALKIEYNVFTMNLIWSHHLERRRESRILRILKYVDREFDIHILAFYVKSLRFDDAKSFHQSI